MSSLIPFSFENHSVRFIPEGESFSVVAKDVLMALDYAESTIGSISQKISHVPEEWRGSHRMSTPGGIQEMLTLKEQGFYFFVNRSDKPKALPLQRWVAGEVLPEIRKTGSYSLPGAQPRNAILAQQLADLLKDKVLVDYQDLVDLANTAHALRHMTGLVETYATRIEQKIGKPLIHWGQEGAAAVAPIRGQVIPRQPVQHGIYKKQSLAESLLDFITNKSAEGAGHRAMQQYCHPYRDATEQERETALNLLLDQGAIVQVQPESLPGARRKAVVYVAQAFVKEVG